MNFVKVVIAGSLSVGLQPYRFYNQAGLRLYFVKVHCAVNTAPTGSSIIVDIKRNGTSIFSPVSNRPTIAAGSYTGESSTFNTTLWDPGDYIQVDIIQVGSTIPGSDLVVYILSK